MTSHVYLHAGGPKSNMELQKELATAHDRIRALEAEVAALKAGK